MMGMDTEVTFHCSCGEVLSSTFEGHSYNYKTYRCIKCGIMYEVRRPQITIRTNFSIADEEWLKENQLSNIYVINKE